MFPRLMELYRLTKVDVCFPTLGSYHIPTFSDPMDLAEMSTLSVYVDP